MNTEIANNTKREILTLMEILNTKNVFEGWSANEKEIIAYHLTLIAKTAIDDYRKSITDLYFNLKNELNDSKQFLK
jgi:hypothetical protein